MQYLLHTVESVVHAIQGWSPMQLLAAALCTVLLGYIGLVSRLATRA